MPVPPTFRPRDALSPGGLSPTRPPPPRLMPTRTSSMSPVRTASSSFLVPQLKTMDEPSSSSSFSAAARKQQQQPAVVFPGSAPTAKGATTAASPLPSSPTPKVAAKPSSSATNNEDDNHPFGYGDTIVEALFECREANYLLYDILRHDVDTQNRHNFDRAVKEGIMAHLRGVAGLRVRDSDVWIQVRPGVASRLLFSHPGNGGMPTVSDGQWPLRFRVAICTFPTEEATTRRHLFGLPNNVFDRAFGLYELWFGRAVLGCAVTLVDTYSPATLVNGMHPIVVSAAAAAVSPSSLEQRQRSVLLRDQHHQHAAAWSTSVEAPRQELPIVGGRKDAMQTSASSAPSFQQQGATSVSTVNTSLTEQRQPYQPSYRQASLESVGLVETTVIDDDPPRGVRQPAASISIDYGTPGSSMAQDPQQYRKHPSILPPRRYFSKEHLVHPSTMGSFGLVEDMSTTNAPGGDVRAQKQTNEQTLTTTRDIQPSFHESTQLSDDEDFDRYGHRPLPRELHSRPHNVEQHRSRNSRDRRYEESPSRRRRHRTSQPQQRSVQRSRQYEKRYADVNEPQKSDLSFSDYSDEDEALRRRSAARQQHHHSSKVLSPRQQHLVSPRSRDNSFHRDGVVDHYQKDELPHELYTNREGTEFFVRVRAMSPTSGEDREAPNSRQLLRQGEGDKGLKRGSPPSSHRFGNSDSHLRKRH